ncbi:Major Facilitator Superfamily (MFS), partial [Pseudoloma neurophilia]
FKIYMKKFLSKLIGLNVLPIKCLYFFVKMQIFSFYFFRGPFCLSRFQISKADWGKITGTLLSLTFFSNMFIAYINDKYKKPKTVLFILLIGATVSFECLYFLLPEQKILFWITLSFYLLFETGVTPLLDHHCIQYLQYTPGTSTASYGRQRLWGAVAYALTNYITEILCKKPNGEFDFTPLRLTVPLLTIPGLIVIMLVVRDYSD